MTSYHLRLLISAWRTYAASARTFREGQGHANLFAYAASRDVENVCRARIELASLYLSRSPAEAT